jgi:hypothetical protein
MAVVFKAQASAHQVEVHPQEVSLMTLHTDVSIPLRLVVV